MYRKILFIQSFASATHMCSCKCNDICLCNTVQPCYPLCDAGQEQAWGQEEGGHDQGGQKNEMIELNAM